MSRNRQEFVVLYRQILPDLAKEKLVASASEQNLWDYFFFFFVLRRAFRFACRCLLKA